MSRVRVACFGLSMDGFGAGPNQDLQNPLGVGGEALVKWVFGTQTFQRMHGDNAKHLTVGHPERRDVDDVYAARGFENIGAWILGRNMFSPHRGPWDDSWKGWWGNNPPYHVPVFVLSHHPRASFAMEGGTVFHFVNDGIQSALDQARAAAGAKDIRIGGGTATIRQYLQAGLIDELHLTISPALLGRGEAFFQGIDLPALGYKCTEHEASPHTTHVVLTK